MSYKPEECKPHLYGSKKIFDLPPSYNKYLQEEGKLNENIKKKFYANQRSLSEDTTISKKSKKRWDIHVNGKKQYYIQSRIQDGKNNLRVFEYYSDIDLKGLFDCRFTKFIIRMLKPFPMSRIQSNENLSSDEIKVFKRYFRLEPEPDKDTIKIDQMYDCYINNLGIMHNEKSFFKDVVQIIFRKEDENNLLDEFYTNDDETIRDGIKVIQEVKRRYNLPEQLNFLRVITAKELNNICNPSGHSTNICDNFRKHLTTLVQQGLILEVKRKEHRNETGYIWNITQDFVEQLKSYILLHTPQTFIQDMIYNCSRQKKTIKEYMKYETYNLNGFIDPVVQLSSGYTFFDPYLMVTQLDLDYFLYHLTDYKDKVFTSFSLSLFNGLPKDVIKWPLKKKFKKIFHDNNLKLPSKCNVIEMNYKDIEGLLISGEDPEDIEYIMVKGNETYDIYRFEDIRHVYGIIRDKISHFQKNLLDGYLKEMENEGADKEELTDFRSWLKDWDCEPKRFTREIKRFAYMYSAYTALTVAAINSLFEKDDDVNSNVSFSDIMDELSFISMFTWKGFSKEDFDSETFFIDNISDAMARIVNEQIWKTTDK